MSGIPPSGRSGPRSDATPTTGSSASRSASPDRLSGSASDSPSEGQGSHTSAYSGNSHAHALNEPGVAAAYQTAPRQWHVAFKRSAQRCANFLRQHPDTTLEPLLDLLGRERGQIARERRTLDAPDFGVRRAAPAHLESSSSDSGSADLADPLALDDDTSFLRTPIEGRYATARGFPEFMAALPARHELAEYLHAHWEHDEAGSLLFLRAVTDLPNHPRYPMTALHLGLEPEGGYRPIRWEHGHLTPAVQRHIDGLLAAALRPDAAADASVLCRRVAAVHWFLAQACPFVRGSAAIADMLSSALFTYHGYVRSGWQPGVLVDITAFFTDLHAFESLYADLMAEAPGSLAEAAAHLKLG